MNGAEQIVRNRKLVLCPSTAGWSVPELFQEYPDCGDFVLYCCACSKQSVNLSRRNRPKKPCHHFRIIFTDGACENNGQPGAKSGVGVAYGSSKNGQLAVPITDLMDNSPLRTNQRAELQAAIIGLIFLAEADKKNTKEPTGKPKDESQAWFVATDSEYVAKGMTEWLPKWRKNGWCTSKGTTPANLDLFLRLDREMKKHEARNIDIGFWRIPRTHNKIADWLAKAAATKGDVDSTWDQLILSCQAEHSSNLAALSNRDNTASLQST